MVKVQNVRQNDLQQGSIGRATGSQYPPIESPSAGSFPLQLLNVDAQKRRLRQTTLHPPSTATAVHPTIPQAHRKRFSHMKTLEGTGRERIETIIRRRGFSFVGRVVRLNSDRWPKRIIGGVLDGKGGREREGVRKRVDERA